MADKQAQTMERLVSKLTALRKTLRGEERKMLDQMVLAAQSEVTAHQAGVRKASAGTKVSDVQMHSANVRRIDAGQKTPQAEARLTPGQKIMQAEPRVSMRITLQDGSYRVTIL